MYGIGKHRRLTAVAVVAGTLLAIAACGGNAGTTGGGSTATAPANSAAPASSAAAEGTTVGVTMKEYAFAFAKQDLKAGAYTFELNNTGTSPHAMAIKGPGVDSEESETISGGQQTTFTVTLQPGTYEVWCPVGNHRAQGMETTLTVK